MNGPCEACPQRASLLQVIRDLKDAEQKYLDELAGAHAEIRRARQAEGAVRRELTQILEKDQTTSGDIRRIADYYKERLNHPKMTLPIDGAGCKAIRWALRRKFTVDQCKQAIDGCAKSDWHMKRGRYANRDGQVQDKLSLIFRDEEYIYKFIQLAKGSEEHPVQVEARRTREAERAALDSFQARDAEALEQARLFGELRQQVPENERDLLDRVLLTQAEFDEAEARRPYMTDEQRREHDEKWASARDARMWGRIVKTYTEANPHVLSLPLEDAA